MVLSMDLIWILVFNDVEVPVAYCMGLKFKIAFTILSDTDAGRVRIRTFRQFNVASTRMASLGDHQESHCISTIRKHAPVFVNENIQ